MSLDHVAPVRFEEWDFLEVSSFLEEAKQEGYSYVVSPLEREFYKESDFSIFFREADAREYASVMGMMRVDELGSYIGVMHAVELAGLAPAVDIGVELESMRYGNNKVEDKIAVMNVNNLEYLQKEMKDLGFSEKLIAEMEERMKANEPAFQLYDSLEATRGRVDVALSFKQSNQSEFYYFNKYRVVHELGPSLKSGDKLMVVTQKEGTDSGQVKEFVQLSDAVKVFNGQKNELKEEKGWSHLLVGANEKTAVKLVSMEDGKVNFVQPEFAKSYRGAAVDQTFYIDKGKSFTAEQAVNLIQGRSVYRDDMVSQAGQQYKTWIKLDFDTPKDRFGNFTLNQYADPAYGFDLSRVLDKFEIKELANPSQREVLENGIKQGNRMDITVEKDGKPLKLELEAVPRYSQINLYNKEGRSEKREQFLKAVDLQPEQTASKNRSRGKNQERGIEV